MVGGQGGVQVYESSGTNYFTQGPSSGWDSARYPDQVFIYYTTASTNLPSDSVSVVFADTCGSGCFEGNIYVYDVSGVTTDSWGEGSGTGHSFTSPYTVGTSPVSFQGGAFLLGMMGSSTGPGAQPGAEFTLSPDNSKTGLSYAEYSVCQPPSVTCLSGYQPTTFPATLNYPGGDWAEAGIAFNPSVTIPVTASTTVETATQSPSVTLETATLSPSTTLETATASPSTTLDTVTQSPTTTLRTVTTKAFAVTTVGTITLPAVAFTTFRTVSLSASSTVGTVTVSATKTRTVTTVVTTVKRTATSHDSFTPLPLSGLSTLWTYLAYLVIFGGLGLNLAAESRLRLGRKWPLGALTKPKRTAV